MRRTASAGALSVSVAIGLWPSAVPAASGTSAADREAPRAGTADYLDRRVQRLLKVALRSHGRRVEPAPDSFCLSRGRRTICVDRPDGPPPGPLPVHSGGLIELHTGALAMQVRALICTPRRCPQLIRARRVDARRWRLRLRRLPHRANLMLIAIDYPEGRLLFDAGLRRHGHRRAVAGGVQQARQRQASG